MKLIKNAEIVYNGELVKKDLLIKDGKIEKISDKIENRDCEILDIDGLYLFPGLIDLNVRLLNDVLSKKNIDKLVKSAKKGGVTTAVITSDFSPRLDSSTLLDFIKSDIEKLDLNLKITAPLVDETGAKLNNIATLINNGASAIWTISSINSNLLKRGMQYAYMKNKPIFCFCYDESLDDKGLMNEGIVSSKLGLSGISKYSESVEVAKVSELSCEYNSKIVLQTLSTKRSLEIIQESKKINPNIFSQVSIHHLIKNENSCDDFNTYAKILPPLRDEEERKALIEELKSGHIDTLTSAHSPKSVLYKDVAFKEALFGLGSIEEFFKLVYSYLVLKEGIDLTMLIEMLCEKPANILGLKNKGKIKEGYDADLFIFNPNKKEQFNNPTSIYDRDELVGEIRYIQ